MDQSQGTKDQPLAKAVRISCNGKQKVGAQNLTLCEITANHEFLDEGNTGELSKLLDISI